MTEAPRTLHALCIGFPGMGKTGSLASLAEAGYNLRIVDLDGNLHPLAEYTKKEALKNIHYQRIFDEHVPKNFTIGVGPKAKTISKIVPLGEPTAYTRVLQLLDNWVEEDGTSFGPVKSWGPRDVLVLDSLTALGQMCMDRVLAMNNRLSMGPRIQDWGEAASQQEAMLRIFREKCQGCNVLVMAHLKLIEPKYLEDLSDDNTEAAVMAKVKELMEKSTTLTPPKLYPAALGRAFPQNVGSIFPSILRYYTRQKGAGVQRLISLIPSEDCDVKLPVAGLPGELPIETGLATIMKKIQG